MIDELLTETFRERAEHRADLAVLAERAVVRGRRKIVRRRVVTGGTAAVVACVLVAGIALNRPGQAPPVAVSPLEVVAGVPGLPVTGAAALPTRAEVTAGDPDELFFALEKIPQVYSLIDVRFGQAQDMMLRDGGAGTAHLELLDHPEPIRDATSTEAIGVGRWPATLYRYNEFHRIVWEVGDGAWMHVTAGSDELAMELAANVRFDRRTHCATPAAPVTLPAGYAVQACDVALRLTPGQPGATLVGATVDYDQAGTAHHVILIVARLEQDGQQLFAPKDRKVAGLHAALVPAGDGMQLQLEEVGGLHVSLTSSRNATEAEVLAMGEAVRFTADATASDRWLPATP
ncbi:hypothetical protein ACQP00_29475 [Dactylosporangium sp. CS-047395]|uniref:hypothetical protein n=1 Tax=Dactylosporangium sp. CS-047395 TaxID=3239936 RepID=UPI003D93D378